MSYRITDADNENNESRFFRNCIIHAMSTGFKLKMLIDC